MKICIFFILNITNNKNMYVCIFVFTFNVQSKTKREILIEVSLEMVTGITN